MTIKNQLLNKDGLFPRDAEGFSLIELIVTLSVASILMTLAVPSFSSFVKDNRLITQTNDFVTALNFARSEAIKRGDRITVCKSTDQVSCSGSGSWDQGWIVFDDVNGDGVVTNPATNVLRVHSSLSGSVSLNGDAGASLDDYVSYVASGATQKIVGGITATQSGLLALCDDRGVSSGKGIQINPSGRISSGTAASLVGSCTP